MTEEQLLDKNRTNREISNANLILIKPGEVRNPAGRPPNVKYISDYLREALQKETDGKPNAQLIAEALIGLSKQPNMRGYVPAIKELLDRIEGKVPDTHKIESDVPISIVFKEVSKDTSESGKE